MAAGSQAIDVGDAVLTFLGDTTQLDASFDRIRDAAQSKLGEAAAGGVEKLSDSVDGLSESMAVGQQGAVKLGEVMTLAGEKTRESMYQARGEGMLLGEMIGVHLPRHVISFIAELPGVGAALSSAFAVTAVVFLLEKIGDLIEKHEQLAAAQRHEAEETESLEIKQRDLAQGLASANLQLEDQIRKLEGRPEVNTLQLAMMAVKKSVDDLATTYATDFQKMDKTLEEHLGFWANLKRTAIELALSFDEVLTVGIGTHGETAKRVQGDKEEVAAINALIAAEEQLNVARRTLAETDPSKDMEKWKAAAGAVAIVAGHVQAAADAASAAVKKVEPEAHELLATLAAKAIVAKGEWQAMGEKITEAGLAAKKANQELANQGAERAAKEAKQALDEQGANIKRWAEEQHAASLTAEHGTEMWAVAQVQATQAAAVAQEDYLRRLIEIYTRAGEVQKAQEEQAKLDVLLKANQTEAQKKLNQEVEHYHTAVAKIVDEHQKLTEANIAKDFEAAAKAAEQLTKAEEELSKAESKLAEDKLSQHFKDQELAITRLAAMHLITEEQKNNRLRALEEQQSTAAIAILTEQLAKEKAVIDAAQSKVTAAQSNPFFTPAQVTELQVNLDKAKTAYTNTESQIIQEQEKFNKQSEANDKSRYGKALLLAESFGREMLAEQLKENHAELLAQELQQKLAKARGEDTTAIQQKINALKQQESALEREAAGNRKIIAAELQLHQLQLLAAQGILNDAKARDLDTTAINKQIDALKKLIVEEQKQVVQQQKLVQEGNKTITTADMIKQEAEQEAAKTMETSLATSFAAMIKGQESFGKAMEKATLQMLASIAQQWAEYYLAQAIADLAPGPTNDPAAAAGMFAAAAALEIFSGAMSGLSAGGSSAAATNPGPVSTTGGSSTVASGGPQTVNVTHLAAGGIVSKPTLFMAGGQ